MDNRFAPGDRVISARSGIEYVVFADDGRIVMVNTPDNRWDTPQSIMKTNLSRVDAHD